MKLLFCLLVGKYKLSKLVFTIISPFLVPIPCPPNPEFHHKPFKQQHSLEGCVGWEIQAAGLEETFQHLLPFQHLRHLQMVWMVQPGPKTIMWLSIKHSWFCYKQRQKKYEEWQGKEGQLGWEKAELLNPRVEMGFKSTSDRHRNEELYDLLFWKACHHSQKEKASVIPVLTFTCCLSVFLVQWKLKWNYL